MRPSTISVKGLDYNYHGGKPVLHDINFEVAAGSRCLLVGANGTGKSTLLRILAGKNLVRAEVRVLGSDPFQSTPATLTYLGSEWALNPVTKRDIEVTELIKSNGGDEFPERLEQLLDLLDIDPLWHMHQVSDGERRRVQLLLGLLRPWDVLLLDEVTVDLDVLVRTDLLEFLKAETERRDATIVYATHIFDGLGDWASHVCHLSNGTVKTISSIDEVAELKAIQQECMAKGTYGASPLLILIARWLREEFESRKKKRRMHIKEEKNDLEKKKDDRKYGDKYYNYWN